MQYLIGTITTSADSAIVTGTDTAWLGNVRPGDLLKVEAYLPLFEVATVDSDTQLTLTANFPVVYAGDYIIFRDFSPALNLPLPNDQDLSAMTIIARALRMLDVSFGALAAAAGARTRHFSGCPTGPTTAGNAAIYQKELYYSGKCTINRISVDCGGLASGLVGDAMTIRIAATPYTEGSPTNYMDVTLTGLETKKTVAADIIVGAGTTVYAFLMAANGNHQDISVEIIAS